MEEIIHLPSRGSNNYLKKLIPKKGEQSKTYKLVTQEINIKIKYLENGQMAIMPFGGPLIIKGHNLLEIGIVKTIDYIPNYGYVLTFE